MDPEEEEDVDHDRDMVDEKGSDEGALILKGTYVCEHRGSQRHEDVAQGR